MVLIDRIRKVAELRGIKLGKICELFGEKSNYLSKVERGLRRMDENRIRVVADFLQCDWVKSPLRQSKQLRMGLFHAFCTVFKPGRLERRQFCLIF